MTAYASRPARVGTVARKTQVQPVKLSETSYTVHSIPHPIHTAIVKRDGAHGLWIVSYPTIHASRVYRYADWDTAMRNASDTIGRKAGADLNAFTGAQSYSMGQQKCPYQPDRMVPRCCDERPEIGTVWCAWHPDGERRKGA